MKQFGRLNHSFIALALLLASTLVTKLSYGSIPPQSKDRVLAQCKPGTSHDDVLQWCHEHDLRVQSSYDKSTGLEYIEVNQEQSAAQVIAHCEASELFEFAEPDYPLTGYLTPNDRGYRLD